MAELGQPVIQPVYGLVGLLNNLFVSLSKGEDGLFEIQQQSQCVETEFYHYNCCGELDDGWGCAYRSLQTLISCLLNKNGTKDTVEDDSIIQKIDKIKLEDKTAPSIKQIQSTLEITKPRLWIDPDYAHTYLCKFGVEGKVEQVWSDKEIELSGLCDTILTHFEKERTPIMIDDAIYAYTLVGCAKIIAKPDTVFKHTCYVLVLDPHTTNKSVFEDYRSILLAQHKASYNTPGDGVKLGVAGLSYEGGDVLGTSGVFWLPYDVMFSKGAHKQFKVYFGKKKNDVS